MFIIDTENLQVRGEGKTLKQISKILDEQKRMIDAKKYFCKNYQLIYRSAERADNFLDAVYTSEIIEIDEFWDTVIDARIKEFKDFYDKHW